MVQEWIRLVLHWKLLHMKVGLFQFLLMTLYLILHFYSCIATTLARHFRNIEMESNDGSHLDSLDALGPGRRILKNMCIRPLTVKRWKNIVPYFPQILTNI